MSIRDFPRNATLRSVGPALLYVNVTWCGHCRALKPTMEQVAGVLGSVVPVYSVDGDSRDDLTSALGVKGFPTIVYVDAGGKRFQYTGERTLDAITSFVCHNSSQRHEFCKRLR